MKRLLIIFGTAAVLTFVTVVVILATTYVVNEFSDPQPGWTPSISPSAQ